MTQGDTAMVLESQGGDKDAFAGIVERYQSLICSLAYNATGSLTQSEDLAQETFVIAWRELRQLREPEKLRSWLCSIARSVISRSSSRRRRDPAQGAEQFESLAETPGSEPLPSERAVNREEESILWRSLEQIPDLYREPMILFYREGRSVERVAEKLELSEDAVRQRLSRGSKLLQEQVRTFVEGALERSTPGKGFTLGVVAALPVWATSSSAAAMGATAAKGAGVAKTAVTLGLAGAILGPLVGLLGGWLGTKASIENTESARERQFMIRLSRITWALAGTFCLALLALIFASRWWYQTHPLAIIAAGIVLTVGYLAGLGTLILRGNRDQRCIRAEEAAKRPAETPLANHTASVRSREYRSRRMLLGLPLVHIRIGVHEQGKVAPARGWIAIGDVAYGGFFAFGGAFAVAPISFGGGAAVGVIALGGGFAGGLLALGGGLGLGGWALGGLAAGWMAYGGCAVGWMGAEGGLALAREFAVGGEALARHANDLAARDFIQNQSFFAAALKVMKASRWAGLAALVPIVLWGWWLLKGARTERTQDRQEPL